MLAKKKGKLPQNGGARLKPVAYSPSLRSRCLSLSKKDYVRRVCMAIKTMLACRNIVVQHVIVVRRLPLSDQKCGGYNAAFLAILRSI